AAAPRPSAAHPSGSWPPARGFRRTPPGRRPAPARRSPRAAVCSPPPARRPRAGVPPRWRPWRCGREPLLRLGRDRTERVLRRNGSSALAKAAATLRRRAGERKPPSALPALLAFTDPARTPDLPALAAGLP